MELLNVKQEINDEIYKLMSMTLCSNTLAQAMVASIVNPPVKGDPSHAVFATEKDKILQSLQKKAEIVYTRLNLMPGVSCMPIEGAMYAFPEVKLPMEFVKHAKSL